MPGPAPDLFLRAVACMRKALAECNMVDDSRVGVTAGVTVIGVTGGSHAGIRLGDHLRAVGAHLVIGDMGALKRDVIELRGW